MCKLGKAKEEKRNACEGETLDLKCPISNQKLTVNYANFGRTSETACPNSANSNTNCKAENSLSIVKAACNGKNSCLVTARNSDFGGDPCGGIHKYLEVKYECVEGNNFPIIFMLKTHLNLS